MTHNTMASPPTSQNASAVTNEDELLLEEESKLAFLRASLSGAQDLTDNMMDILSSFEKRLSDLENTMLPIHKKTQSLSTAQKNIGVSLTAVELVETHHGTSSEPESEYSRRSPMADHQGFLDWVEQVDAASSFFQRHNSYKGAADALKNLRQMTKMASKKLEAHFRALLSDYNKIVDIDKFVVPPPKDFSLIPATAVERLGQVAATMENQAEVHKNPHLLSFVGVLTSMRADILKRSLELAMQQANHQGGDKSSSDHHSSSQQGIAINYEKSTHRLITHMQFLCALLACEREMVVSLLDFTNIEQQQVDKHICEIAERPVTAFIAKAEELVVRDKHHVSGRDRVLLLLDILGNWKAIWPEFERVLFPSNWDEGKSSLRLRMREFESSLMSSAKQQILDRIEAIRSHPAKQVRTDGGYHTLTVETIQLLKRLTQYKDTVGLCISPSTLAKETGSSKIGPHSGLSSPMAMSPNSKQSAIVSVVSAILSALEYNLSLKSQNYKIRSLVHIFLLNNYHYIMKNAKNSRLIDFAGQGFEPRYQRYIIYARNQYQEASWDEAREHITVLDAPKLLAHGKTNLSSQARKAIKAKFAGWNSVLDELYQTQKHFSVPDSDLRSQLRNENVEIIVGEYRRFLDTFAHVDFSNHADKYIKYHPPVLEQMLNRFFDEEA